jgi:hypothetical protein
MQEVRKANHKTFPKRDIIVEVSATFFAIDMA